MEGNFRRQTDRPAVVTPWSCSVVQCGRDMMKDTDVREQEDLEERRWGVCLNLPGYYIQEMQNSTFAMPSKDLH